MYINYEVPLKSRFDGLLSRVSYSVIFNAIYTSPSSYSSLVIALVISFDMLFARVLSADIL